MKIGSDEIEVFVSALKTHAQVRVRERVSDSDSARSQKCSILMSPAQLRAHASECLAVADKIALQAPPPVHGPTPEAIAGHHLAEAIRHLRAAATAVRETDHPARQVHAMDLSVAARRASEVIAALEERPA